jgi:Fic family protein
MQIEEFNEKTGKLIMAPSASYYTFEPFPLPIKFVYDAELVNNLSQAIMSLGNLSGAGRWLKNPYLLISPYLNKEAVLSSKIEGTRTSLSEVFLHEKEPKRTTEGDLLEVMNYIKALHYGLTQIKTNKITEQLIKEMHKILIHGARGEFKSPGQYKTQPNWIGSTLDPNEARFVPAHPNSVPRLMVNLIYYLNEFDNTHPLIKVALMHYQFETIHPFRDGNGRLGRMLIILYLCSIGVLTQPLLYLSAYFEKFKDQYNERLYAVSAKGDVNGWLNFFFKGVKVQADDAVNRSLKLQEYLEKSRLLLQNKTNSSNTLIVLDQLFTNPYITLPEAKKLLKTKNLSTPKNVIDILVKNSILKEITGRKRNRIFIAPIINKILEGS